MLFVPIGRDQSLVRRQPLVCWAIIGLNALAFLVFNLFSTGPNEAAIESKWKEIVSLLESRPYLVVPHQVERFLSGDDRRFLAEARRTMRQKGELPAPWIQQTNQTTLNRLTRELDELASASAILRNAYVPARGGVGSMLSSLFVHAGLMHLLGNMLFLFVTGPFVEDVFGRPLFTLLYLTGGMIATLSHAWQHPGSLAPLVGASGAIAAIMGAYLVRFFHSRIQFFFLPIIFLPRFNFRFFIPAFVVLPLWFMEQFLLATRSGTISPVAWWTHVGGFVYGVTIALLFRVLRVEQRWIDPAITRQISWNQDERLVQASTLQAQGKTRQARDTIGNLVRSQPRNLDARRTAYEFAMESDDWPAATEHANRLLEMYIGSGEGELSIALIRDFTSSRTTIFSEKFYARAASFLQRESEHDWAMDLYREVELRGSEDSSLTLRALTQMAELTRRKGNRQESDRLLRKALRHPLCDGDWRERVERDLARPGREISDSI